MQTTLEAALTQLSGCLNQEREALVKGLIKQAVSLHDTKTLAIRDFEAALQSEPASAMSETVQKQIASLMNTAHENAHYLIAMKHGVNRLLERINNLDASTQVGTYAANGHKVSFSQTLPRTNAYVNKV